MLLHFPGVCLALSFLAFTGHLPCCGWSLMDCFAPSVLTISPFATTLNSYEQRMLPFSLWLPSLPVCKAFASISMALRIMGRNFLSHGGVMGSIPSTSSSVGRWDSAPIPFMVEIIYPLWCSYLKTSFRKRGMSLKVTEGSLDVILTLWKLGLYISLLGSTGSKKPYFIIHGNSSTCCRSRQGSWLSAHVDWKSPIATCPHWSYLQFHSIEKCGRKLWEHTCHPATAVLYDCRRAFPSPCLLEGQDTGQCCLATEIIVTTVVSISILFC